VLVLLVIVLARNEKVVCVRLLELLGVASVRYVCQSRDKEFVVVVYLHLSKFGYYIFRFCFALALLPVLHPAVDQTPCVRDALDESVVYFVLLELEREVFPVVNDALHYLPPV